MSLRINCSQLFCSLERGTGLDLLGPTLAVYPVLYALSHSIVFLFFCLFFKQLLLDYGLKNMYILWGYSGVFEETLCRHFFSAYWRVKIRIATWCSSKSKFIIISKSLTMMWTFIFLKQKHAIKWNSLPYHRYIINA